jgi:hypothetical protein
MENNNNKSDKQQLSNAIFAAAYVFKMTEPLRVHIPSLAYKFAVKTQREFEKEYDQKGWGEQGVDVEPDFNENELF